MIKDETERFFIDGMQKINLTHSKHVTELMRQLENVTNNELPPGFTLQEKYPSTKDLRPEPWAFAPEILRIVTDSDVSSYLNSLSGQRLILRHVQVRIAYPSKSSYMNWHRDTHKYHKDNAVGNFPPVFKLIIYPKNESEPTGPVLLLSRGSHLRYLKSRFWDILLNGFIGGAERIYPDNESGVFFNTFLMHKAMSPKDGSAQIRLIYTFTGELQNAPGFDEMLAEEYKKQLKECEIDRK